ncbi:hypothetical protein CP904_26005 [Enterobacter cloacae]|nr:hypothetical protein CP904_26005 [Enterobacter cloacae]PDQ12418.1 hypothetical protein CKK21_25335 [Enterobacter cloacae]RLS12620.1 hypothetical protein CKO00_24120 [Enterobacter cloacae]
MAECASSCGQSKIVVAVNNLHRGFNMTDFKRQPSRQQAVRLNWFEIKLRQLCYLLAQKGNPEL